MSLDAILDDLGDFALFGGIDAHDLAKVSDLFEAGSYPAGARIIEEGTTGSRLYVLTSGQVQVSIRCSSPHDAGDESILASHGRGATFGEMELIDMQARSATITAIEPTHTIELTNMGLYNIFLREPEIFRMLIMNLARDLSRRLRVADQQLSQIRIGKSED